ncbi:MAG: arylsulfotransferase family protein [Bradymonadaceae bacterium]
MSDETSSTFETVARLVSGLGILVLTFLAGAFTTEFQVFPYPQLLERPFEALRAYDKKRELTLPNPAKSEQWNRVKDWESGVVTHQADKTLDGYTFFTSAHASAAFLIDQNGEVVHEWGKRFRKAFPEPSHLTDPVPEHKISWADAHLFPNGDVLGAYAADGDTPYGYGLVKLNRDSEVIWSWPGHVHHDFDVQPDGSIWLLDQSFRDTTERPIPNAPNWEDRVLEGFAVKLSPQGKELKRIPLVEAYASHHGKAFPDRFAGHHRWDIIHANDVEVIGKDFASHHYFAEPGHLMISSRAFDSVAILDPATEKIVWSRRGFWKKQHDPDAMPDGEIWVFDNQGYGGPGGATQVAKFDPQTLRISRSFHGNENRRFHCTWWGKQTPLANGNVLIADSLNGRILEVDDHNEIVWEWHTPSVADFKGKQFVPNIKAPVTRIDPSTLKFDPDRPSLDKSMLTVEADRFD